MAELSRIGKYEIRRELGRGAMGVVYEGYDPMIKRIVALKTIRAEALAGDMAENVIARFRREAQAAGRLSHPNIVAIYEIGEDEGLWYIAMEFIKGRELKDYFQANERFAPADIVRIMTQILDALGYAHRQGVVHRDVKPANILLLADGAVKVTDFGIAHIESSNMTQVGTVLGTPSYMSPEQIMGLPIDGRADLFSAGVILYQFLTGERPFSGSATATMHKVLEEDPLPPSRFNVQVPGAMDGVVRKALAKRPDERFQSAEDFATAIKAASQRETTATEPTLLATLDATVLASNNASLTANTTLEVGKGSGAQGSGLPGQPSSTVAPAKKSQTAAIAIVAAVAIIAIATGMWTMMQRSPSDTTKLAPAPAPTPAASASAGAAPPAAPTAAIVSPSPTPPAALTSASEGPKPVPGAVMISAQGLIDSNEARYQNDKALLQNDLRADSKSQVVAKALGLLLDGNSLAKNYEMLSAKLFSQSGSYIATVVEESPPRLGKDGLMSMTTQAVVNVKALQKSLNQLSRDERIEFIRASGDPKVSVRIAVRDADQPSAPAQPSPVAENLLKERIKAFGFRTWSDEGDRPPPATQNANFAVQGEVSVKKLTTRLEASGLVITKITLVAWTVKCVDRETGEEIYFNTTLPKGAGSWAGEGEAMKAIGGKVADEFSRNFFLQHVTVTGRKVTLIIDGMPDTVPEEALQRELIGLPAVITLAPRVNTGSRAYNLELAGSGPEGDLVASGLLNSLNAKLGRQCFTLGRISGAEVSVAFDKTCGDADVLSRFEHDPPAGLFGAPSSRQKAVIKDPETLRRMMI